MPCTLVYSPEAQSEAREIYRYYEARQSGLGDRFFSELDAGFGRIKGNPRQYQFVHQEVRRIHLKRFPISIFFKILDDQLFGEQIVLIAGIKHQQSDPKNWPV